MYYRSTVQSPKKMYYRSAVESPKCTSAPLCNHPNVLSSTVPQSPKCTKLHCAIAQVCYRSTMQSPKCPTVPGRSCSEYRQLKRLSARLTCFCPCRPIMCPAAQAIAKSPRDLVTMGLDRLSLLLPKGASFFYQHARD